MRDRPADLFRGRRHGTSPTRPPGAGRRPADPPPDPDADLARYVILVPCHDHIPLAVERQLRQCEARGLEVTRTSGVSDISFGRCMMASRAMLEGKEAILFVDSDIIFAAEDAIAILRRPEPIVAGAYAQKRFGKLNLNLDPSVEAIPFGDKGGDMEARGVGAGFLRIRAEALRRMIEFHGLPCCTATEEAVWPWFLPMVAPDETSGEWGYVGEDYAFLRRAREAGIKLIVDTRIRLFHLGMYPYGWEEAAGHKVRRLPGVTIPHFFPSDVEETTAPEGEPAGSRSEPRTASAATSPDPDG